MSKARSTVKTRLCGTESFQLNAASLASTGPSGCGRSTTSQRLAEEPSVFIPSFRFQHFEDDNLCFSRGL